MARSMRMFRTYPFLSRNSGIIQTRHEQVQSALPATVNISSARNPTIIKITPERMKPVKPMNWQRLSVIRRQCSSHVRLNHCTPRERACMPQIEKTFRVRTRLSPRPPRREPDWKRIPVASSNIKGYPPCALCCRFNIVERGASVSCIDFFHLFACWSASGSADQQ